MSREISAIIHAYNKLDLKREKAALATVVHVEGSSYRRPGARMLITADGRLTGAISGGCLEGDALRKALLVIHKGEAMVVTYDTTDEDDAKLGVGLGCNGIIHVLIEPLKDVRENPAELLKAFFSRRRNGVLVTLFSLTDKKQVPEGTCALFTETEQYFSKGLAPGFRLNLEADARVALQNGASSFRSYREGERLSGFLELLLPPVSLVIVGAGNDIVPLTELAHTLGWEITIIDGRASHARRERFPLAKEVLISKAEHIADIVDIDAQTCFVLMTHNYNYDLAALTVLLEKEIRYIGVLGPKKKLQRMLEEPCLENKQDFSAVYGPVGLDIGAESPEEIALSIVAEIKAVLSGKDVASLRDLPDSIHSRQN